MSTAPPASQPSLPQILPASLEPCPQPGPSRQVFSKCICKISPDLLVGILFTRCPPPQSPRPGNSHFTKWPNYAWSLTTAANSLRRAIPSPPRRRKHPGSFPSSAWDDFAKSDDTQEGHWQRGPHTHKGGQGLGPQSGGHTSPKKAFFTELSPSRPSGGLPGAATESEHRTRRGRPSL